MKAFPYAAALGKKFGASVFACHIIKPTCADRCCAQIAPDLYEVERDATEKELG
jgi:hypothetical protein